MTKYRFCYLLFLLLLLGCKTVTIDGGKLKITNQNLILGTVGDAAHSVFQDDYKNVAFPKYSTPIRVQALLIPFNNSSYGFFLKANERQPKQLHMPFSDTLSIKPNYLKLEIIDRLEVVNSLNNNTNTEVFNLLKTNKELHVITSMALALDQKDLNSIMEADELFLESSGIKNYSLMLYNDGKLQQQINFNDGVVFAYQTSNCCWKENEKYQLEIVGLVESDDNCPNASYQSAKRAKKDINYYKF